jgi:hypothetical protein
MMKKFLLVVLLLWSGLANAEIFENWTTEEKEWFALSTIVQSIDYGTTRDMLYKQADRGYYELNPLIGPHPSPGRLAAFQVGAIVGNYFLSDWLGHENRLFWLKTHVAVELVIIGHNLSIGARLGF